MKETIPLNRAEAKWLFVSDVDDTLLGSNSELNILTQALVQIANSVVVVYNSSRPCASLRQTIKWNPNLPYPDFLIGALGTEIEIGPSGDRLQEYSRQINEHWDRKRIDDLAAELGFVPHAAEYQTPLKASYDVLGIEAYQDMVHKLDEEGLEVKIIFSGGKNLDLIPMKAGKGKAIIFLNQYLNIDPASVVVAGDSANDLEMFSPPNKGIIVANADEELKHLQDNLIYHASAEFAAGVLEGLQHWGVLA